VYDSLIIIRSLYNEDWRSKPSLTRLQLIRIEIWKLLFTVECILQKTRGIKKADESPVCSDKTFDTFSSNLHYYVQKQVQILGRLSMNKCIVFIVFEWRLYINVFYLFWSALFIWVSLNFPFIFVISFLCFIATVCFINPDSEGLLCCGIPDYDTIPTGRWIPPFRRNKLLPSLGWTTLCFNPGYYNTNPVLVCLMMFASN
jgi:hypothetical protein